MKSILIVDDSSLSRRMIVKILQPEEYELLEASSGLEALETLRTKTPDCILLDLLMPEMEGREFLKILQQQGSKIPVIVITADIQKTTRSECLELGAMAVLNKIAGSEELIGWVKKAIKDLRENKEN